MNSLALMLVLAIAGRLRSQGVCPPAAGLTWHQQLVSSFLKDPSEAACVV